MRTSARRSAASASPSLPARSAASASSLALAGALEVDVIDQLGDVGQDDHAVVADLDEAAVHGDVLVAARGERDLDDADAERAEERRVAGEEGDVAALGAAHDHVGFAREQDALGRDDLDLHRHSVATPGP